MIYKHSDTTSIKSGAIDLDILMWFIDLCLFPVVELSIPWVDVIEWGTLWLSMLNNRETKKKMLIKRDWKPADKISGNSMMYESEKYVSKHLLIHEIIN